MTTVVTTIETRNIGSPSEVRQLADKGRAEVIRLADMEIGRAILEPGWRWSDHVKPMAETDLCEFTHLGFVMQGRMTIRMDDGTETTIGEGDFVAIPPGHDAWVEGDETCIFLDFADNTDYGKPHEH